MTAQQIETIVKCYEKGLSFEDIGYIIGKKASTVKQYAWTYCMYEGQVMVKSEAERLEAEKNLVYAKHKKPKAYRYNRGGKRYIDVTEYEFNENYVLHEAYLPQP